MQLLLKPPCGSQIEWPRITNVSNLFNMCLSYALGLHIHNHDIKNFPREIESSLVFSGSLEEMSVEQNVL